MIGARFGSELAVHASWRRVSLPVETDAIRLEIKPAGDGCVLTLLDTIDEVGEATRDDAGWHVCLRACLRACLDT